MDWKQGLAQKLGSRKLWAGLISFITALLTAFNVDKLTMEQTIIIVSGIGGLVMYMLSEAHVDGKREGSGEETTWKY